MTQLPQSHFYSPLSGLLNPKQILSMKSKASAQICEWQVDVNIALESFG